MKNIGISKPTFYEWVKRFPNFANALKKGREPVDIQVEDAVLKSSLGYTVKLKKPIKVRKETQKFGEGKIVTEEIEYVEEEVYIAPVFMAQAYWLNNRSRKNGKWSNMKYVAQEQTEAADYSLLDGIAKRMKEKANGESKDTGENKPK